MEAAWQILPFFRVKFAKSLKKTQLLKIDSCSRPSIRRLRRNWCAGIIDIPYGM